MTRVLKPAIAACFAVWALSTPSTSLQVADRYIDVSDTLAVQAKAKLGGGETEAAQDLYERALVANPANMQALIGLGKTHEAQGRVGRGLKYYRQALTIDPNALRALEAQAIAFLKRDMPDRAEINRDRLATLCRTGCEPLENVKVAIEGYRAEQANAQVAEASNG